MARTVQFTIGASKTINLGDYNSMRVEAQIVVAPDDVEDLPTAKRLAQLELKSLLEETWKAQRRQES